MIDKSVDLCVVGGGIYGATVFWEAVSRGLKAALLEQNDFASGASCNSLKTIHGGFRYLQRADIFRTLKSDREKRVLKSIAEPLVKPLTCSIPASRSLKNNPFTYSLASVAMNSLSWLSQRCDNVGSASELGFSPVFVKKQNPFFSTIRSDSNYLVWQDAQVVNSERLVLAFINAAKQAGGQAYNYCEAEKIIKNDQGFVVKTPEFEIQTQYLVDCTSSFSLAKKNNFLANDIQQSTEYGTAVNLVLDQQFSEQAFALQSNIGDLEKQGLLFFSPWKNTTLAGTWYFESERFSSCVEIDDETLSQCVLDIVNALSSIGVEIDQETIKNKVIDIHFGVLPATVGENTIESRLIANNQIQLLTPNYWRIQSTKYTLARETAAKMIDTLAKQNARIIKSKTHNSPLLSSVKSEDKEQQILFERYGSDAKAMCQTKLDYIPGSERLFEQEVMHIIKNEQVQRLSDVLYRRLNINHHRLFSKKEIDWIANAMKLELAWDEQQLEFNVAEVKQREEFKGKLKDRICS